MSGTPNHWCQALAAISVEAGGAGLRPGRRPALPETFGLLGAPTPLVSDTLGHRWCQTPDALRSAQ